MYGSLSLFEWNDALKIPNNFEYAGYSDWRVPTAKELNTLVYCSNGKIIQYKKDGFDSIKTEGGYGCGSRANFQQPTINQIVFPKTNTTVLGSYWSSSPHAQYKHFAWKIGFYRGSDGWIGRDIANSLRLVRSGQ